MYAVLVILWAARILVVAGLYGLVRLKGAPNRP